MKAAAFYILLSVFSHGKADVIRTACPDLVCVGKVIETARTHPEIGRIRVFTEEPAAIGPGEITTPALADYQGA